MGMIDRHSNTQCMRWVTPHHIITLEKNTRRVKIVVGGFTGAALVICGPGSLDPLLSQKKIVTLHRVVEK